MTSQDRPPRVARLANLAELPDSAAVADLSAAGGVPADGAVARFTDLDDADGPASADRPTPAPVSFDDLAAEARAVPVAGLERSSGLPEASPTADLTRGSGRSGRSRAGRTGAGRTRDGSAGGRGSASGQSSVNQGEPSGEWDSSADGRATRSRRGDPAGGQGSTRGRGVADGWGVAGGRASAGDQGPAAADGRSSRGAGSAEEQAGHAPADADDGIVRPDGSRGSRRRGERSPRGRGRSRAGDDTGQPDARTPDGTRRGRPEPPADPVAAAKEICLRLLTDRARTRHELAQALHRKGIPDEAANQVLGRFDEVGLIDDAAFAGQWVRSRHQYRGLGRRAIAMELRRKGVADDIAGEALAEVDPEAEEQRARQLVDRKLRTARLATPEDRTVAARRLVGMLARKGYPAGVAYGVVRTALAEHGADDDELGAEEPPPED